MYNQQINQLKLPILIEFWASWCLPCQASSQLVKEITKQYKNKIKVDKINVDKNPKIAQKFKVKGLPCFVILKQGKEIDRKIGAQTKNSLCQMIKKAF